MFGLKLECKEISKEIQSNNLNSFQTAETQIAHKPGWPVLCEAYENKKRKGKETEEKEKAGTEQERSGLLN